MFYPSYTVHKSDKNRNDKYFKPRKSCKSTGCKRLLLQVQKTIQ